MVYLQHIDIYALNGVLSVAYDDEETESPARIVLKDFAGNTVTIVDNLIDSSYAYFLIDEISEEIEKGRRLISLDFVDVDTDINTNIICVNGREQEIKAYMHYHYHISF